MIRKLWVLFSLLAAAIGSANAQASNGIILNQQYVDMCSTPHTYLIATLPTSTAGTYDHLHIVATLGTNWSSTGNSTLDATFGNRGGFSYLYTVKGPSVYGSYTKLSAYQQSDGSVNLYLYMAGCTADTYTVLENQQETVYSSPVDTLDATPPGTLVFDTSNPLYPAANTTDFAGDFYTNGSVGVGTASPTSPLTVAKDNSNIFPNQFMIQGSTNGKQQLLLGYNTTSDFASIQSVKQGTALEPLLLNPLGVLLVSD